MKTFRIRPAIFYGLNAFVTHMPFLIGAGLVVSLGTLGFPIIYSLLLTMLFKLPGNGVVLLYDLQKSFATFLQGAEPSALLIAAILVGAGISAIIGMWALAVWIKIGLKLYDTKSASIHDLFSLIPDLPQIISIMLVISIVAVFGFVALILPGIYWIIRTYFAVMSAIDTPQEGLGPIGTSFAITKGIFWRLILLGIVLGVLNLIIYLSTLSVTQFCSGLSDEAQSSCMIVSGMTSLIISWICATISTFIKVHVYRQLVPRS